MRSCKLDYRNLSFAESLPLGSGEKDVEDADVAMELEKAWKE
jgi:hypothetical protein